MTSPALTPEQGQALEIARNMAKAGIPIFVAAPSAKNRIGFNIPKQWEKTVPDPGVVDTWQPGWALCAVMGHGLDLIDIDPRNDGDPTSLAGILPYCYGGADTPSGGKHLFIKSIGVGSKANFLPGIDFKSGTADGSSRGFAFIAPTVRPSKVDDLPKPYVWFDPVDLEILAAHGPTDLTGSVLTQKLKESQPASSPPKANVYASLGNGALAAFYQYQAPQSWKAAELAIAAKLYEVSSWDPKGGSGFRNTLERAGMTLGGYVGGGYLDEALARQKLEDAVTDVWPDGPDSDDLLWIEQGLTDGAKLPFSVYTQENEEAWERAKRPVTDERRPASEEELSDQLPGDAPPPFEWGEWDIQALLRMGGPFDPHEDNTDQGQANATLLRMYPALRYAKDAGMWLQRDAEVWISHSDSLAKWAIAEAAKLMPLGLQPIPKNKDEWTAEHAQAHRRGVYMSTLGANKIAPKMEALVRGNHVATVKLAKLDDNPEILWAGGQPWDLKASLNGPVGAYWIDINTPHLHTALCAPDASVPTPRWDAFIEAVFPDPELRAWALRVLSVALTGHSSAVLPILYGKERSGKTSLIELLVRVLGTYAHAANVKLLGDNKDHDTIIYDLKGRRLSFVDEGPKRGHDATERLKQLTGGGSLTARPMNSNPITFRPSHTLVLTTNNEPSMADPALRARMRLIPCDSEESAVQPTRKALNDYRLRNEAPGILAKLMKEAAAWLADENTASNAAAPAIVRETAQSITENQDPVRDWVENYTRPDEPGTPGRQLYTAFAAWHQDHPLFKRMAVTSETLFGRTLSDMGYPSNKLGGKWYRKLSVMGPLPPGVRPPQTPPPNFGLEDNEAMPSRDLSVTKSGGSGGLNGRVEAELAKSEESRSDLTFEAKNGRLACFTEKVVSNTHTPHIPHISPIEPLRGAQRRQADSGSCDTPSDQQVKGLAGGGGASRQTPDDQGFGAYSASELAETASDLRRCEKAGVDLPELPFGYSPLRNLTAYQVTVWAEARNIDKTAARAELKTIKAEAKAQEKLDLKHAKLQSAEGAKVNLPAGCDRTGDVRALTLDQAAAAVRACLSRTPALTVDVETAGYPLGHEHYRLRTVQLGDDQLAVTFDPHQSDQAELIKQLLSEAPALHAHSATADLAPLADASLIDYQAGWDRMFDTGIVALLNDPKSTGSDPGLKQLASSVLGPLATAPAADKARGELFAAGGWLKETDVTTPLERSGWAQVDSEATTMVRYAASDVLDTAAIAKRLPGVPEALLSRERAVQRQTAPLALIGVRLDYEHVQEMRSIHEPLREQSKARALAMAGGDIDNPGSPTQVAKKLTAMGVQLPLTKPNRKTGAGGGQPSADKAALEPLQHLDGPVGDLVTEVLDYRHNNTLINMFLVPFSLLCEKGDGRARPTVYTLGTDTGRMSVVRPNLQQLSRQGGIRACITADPGQLMVGADFSGIELRVAAALSQDPNLIRILAEGRDIHAEIALQVWGADQELSAKAGKPTPKKEHRYKAKPMVFGRIYGGGAATLAGQTGTTLQEANAVIETLDALAPGLAAWSTQMRNWVKGGGTQFPTYAGRIIYMDPDQPHKAGNYAIQGSARELLVDSMLKWADTRWGGAVLLPVHDELDAFVPEGEAVEATAALVSCMETELYGVKIIAEPSEPSFYWQDSS